VTRLTFAILFVGTLMYASEEPKKEVIDLSQKALKLKLMAKIWNKDGNFQGKHVGDSTLIKKMEIIERGDYIDIVLVAEVDFYSGAIQNSKYARRTIRMSFSFMTEMYKPTSEIAQKNKERDLVQAKYLRESLLEAAERGLTIIIDPKHLLRTPETLSLEICDLGVISKSSQQVFPFYNSIWRNKNQNKYPYKHLAYCYDHYYLCVGSQTEPLPRVPEVIGRTH